MRQPEGVADLVDICLEAELTYPHEIVDRHSSLPISAMKLSPMCTEAQSMQGLIIEIEIEIVGLDRRKRAIEPNLRVLDGSTLPARRRPLRFRPPARPRRRRPPRRRGWSPTRHEAGASQTAHSAASGPQRGINVLYGTPERHISLEIDVFVSSVVT